jgi:hypothetical protein
MRHFASRAFWDAHEKLPEQIRVLADKSTPCSKKIRGIYPCSSKRSDAFGPFASAYAIGRWRLSQTAI